MAEKIKISPLGDRALLVDFEQKIDPAINAAILALAEKTMTMEVPGVEYVAPAYCSLTVGFNPALIGFSTLSQIMRSVVFLENMPTMNMGRILKIPVCYAKKYAPDMSEISELLHISPMEITALHTNMEYKVFMLGFMPGFPYMGILPEALECPRKAIPRKVVPARSVGLAGQQTGIYPLQAPGGWQIIGRTPIPVFDLKSESPFLFRAGDRVRFYSICESEFDHLENDVAAGHFDLSSLHA